MDFIKANWQLLVSGIVGLISVICYLLKKPVDSSLWTTITNKVFATIPTLINTVEHDGDGKAKKAQVIDACIVLYEKLLKRSLTSDELASVTSDLSDEIELILSTPQKKGE